MLNSVLGVGHFLPQDTGHVVKDALSCFEGRMLRLLVNN